MTSQLAAAQNFVDPMESGSQNAFFSIAKMIALRVLESPDAPAIVQADRAMSFIQLDELSTRVAASLRNAGVQTNDPVGLYFESSIEFVAAALGVWKAGAAYLPIDPKYPVDRANYILSDSGAPVVITRSGLRESISSDRWKTLLIDDLPAAEFTEDAPPSSEDLAYVIYTSGSTGLPKGVEITHGNLRNLVEWHNREFSVTRWDRATQIAGPGFDAAVWEIWPYLAAGASIHFPTQEARLSGVQLRNWLLASEITISFLPTVLAEEILRLDWPANTSLRFLLTGGDALHTFPRRDLPFQFVNNYGPTECTVVAASGPVIESLDKHDVPAIGRAIRNTSIYLLDEFQNEVADGDPGEMYISGASVGRGYRNRPELTAESFVNICVSGTVQRAFRTGDMARKLPDGQFAFLGRTDDQIKIRGFRIELGEIASVLNRHPLVNSSAVIARGESCEKRLVAYIVPADGAELWDGDLREALNRQLPDYMVPSDFVLMSRIPITSNGKLDKAALPPPTDLNRVQPDSYVEPRNELEKIVEATIQSILGLNRVSIHDNFFLLGGHSLMGAQLIAKMRDIFDVELVLRNIFECPTVAKLAARIEALLEAKLEAMSDEEIDEALRANTLDHFAYQQSSVGGQ